MKIRIQNALEQLVGLSVTGSTRAAAMECLKFGQRMVVDKRGDVYNVGEFGLHLQCPWRFTNKTEILVGSSDLYEPATEDEADEDFDWDIAGANLRDVKLQALLSQPIVTEAADADMYGGFALSFSQGLTLSVFPVLTKKDEYSEFWRLLNNRVAPGIHLVVGPLGVE